MADLQSQRNTEWRAILWIGIVVGIPASISFIIVGTALLWRLISIVVLRHSQGLANESMYQTLFSGFALIVAFLGSCAGLASAWLTYRLIRMQRDQMAQQTVQSNDQRIQYEMERNEARIATDIEMVRTHIFEARHIADNEKIVLGAVNMKQSDNPVRLEKGKIGVPFLMELLRYHIGLMMTVRKSDNRVKEYYLELVNAMYGGSIVNYYKAIMDEKSVKDDLKIMVNMVYLKYQGLYVEYVTQTGFDVTERYEISPSVN